MPDEKRQTRTHLMQLFEGLGLHPRHDLGQNFLIDINLIEFAVDAAELTRDDVVLEVGAGTGGLTTYLADRAGHVVSVEYDANMHRLASAATAGKTNVTLLNCDALRNKNHIADEVLAEVEKRLNEQPGRSLKLVANLPYNIATPLVSNLVATDLPWTRMVITIQFELALRMKAGPGNDHYGALSVWLESQSRVEILRKLNPKVFWPRPKVDSAIVRIVPDLDKRSRIRDRAFFLEYVRGAFAHRRKLHGGVLAAMYRDRLDRSAIDAILAELSLPENSRAEELSPEQHVDLANRLLAAMPQSPFAPRK
jgi:16S rRNA (adenine1518-N6/adenine1519-N6)-dimethyltransferase